MARERALDSDAITAELDRLELTQLRARPCEKWNTYPADVLPAWVAEMDFPIAEPIARSLQQAIDRREVGYPVAARDTGLREAFAEHMQTGFAWTVDPRRVEIVTDVVQALYISVHAFAERGEGAIVQTPIYPPFLRVTRESGRAMLENRLVEGPRGYEIDFDALEQALAPSTRLLLLCNPHNPTGRAYTRGEVEALAELALRHDLVVVSDEIHADLVYDERTHVPFGSLAPEVAARTITLTSPSKAYNIAGLRCAVAHFGSETLQRRFVECFPRSVRGGLNILGLYASIAAWREGEPWLRAVRAYLESNRDHLLTTLARRLPGIRCHGPEATYLAWLDCSALALPRDPAAVFLREGRVALSAGRAFGSGFDQFARLNFATSRALLDEVVERMVIAVDRVAAGRAQESAPDEAAAVR